MTRTYYTVPVPPVSSMTSIFTVPVSPQAVRYTSYLGGKTNTAAALALLRSDVFVSSNGHRTDAPKFAVVITDGNSNINEPDTVTEAIRTHVDGVHVIAVPIGKSFVNMAEITAIASEPKTANIIRIDDVKGLTTIVSNVTASMCDGKFSILCTLFCSQ